MIRYKHIFRIPALLAVCLLSPAVFAQKLEVKAEANKRSIKIGEHINLKLTAKQDDKTVLVWPAIADTITAHFEVVKRGNLDTSFSEDKKEITFSQQLIVTSFDSGTFAIPPFPFLYLSGNDTLTAYTDKVVVEVNTITIDPAKGFKDITGPLDAPFSLMEILPYLLAGLLLVAIGLGIFFLVKKLVRKKPKAEAVLPPPVVIPAHVIAYDRLAELEQKKLWQSGKMKLYYTELTAIVREYIHNRYSIDASEMTTAETLSAIRLTDAAPDAMNKVMQLLKLADLVKFAKGQPTDTEHEFAFTNARTFIDLTKYEPVAENSNRNPENA